MHQQVGLDLGDARIVLHVAADLRFGPRPVGIRAAGWRWRAPGRARKPGALPGAPGRACRAACVRSATSSLHRIQHALLAVAPRPVRACRRGGRRGCAESFRAAARGRSPPSSCCAECFRRRIPGETPIWSERKRRLAADLAPRSSGRCDGPPAPRPVNSRAGHQRAHGAMVVVARSGLARGRIVQAGDDVDVVAERRERRQARRHRVSPDRCLRGSSSAPECRCR